VELKTRRRSLPPDAENRAYMLPSSIELTLVDFRSSGNSVKTGLPWYSPDKTTGGGEWM
jgi:hypothetical protein